MAFLAVLLVDDVDLDIAAVILVAAVEVQKCLGR